MAKTAHCGKKYSGEQSSSASPVKELHNTVSPEQVRVPPKVGRNYMTYNVPFSSEILQLGTSPVSGFRDF